jgi:hypothetical protein
VFVCGLTVAKKPGLTVDIKKITDVPRFSRESNLHYNACPYYVTLKYQKLRIQFDFSNDQTLDDINNFATYSLNSLSFGVLNYDEKGWRVAKGYYYGENPEITINKSQNSIFVISEFNRKDEHSNSLKNCIDILIVGNERWAIGGICTEDKSKLAQIKPLLSGEPLLFFEK